MIALLLILAGGGTVAYGAIDDHTLTALGGFLSVLFGLWLHELPVWRRVRSAPADLDPKPCPVIELDFSAATFDWPQSDERKAA